MHDVPEGLQEWLERMIDQGAVALRLRVGEGKSPETVAMFAQEGHQDAFTSKDQAPQVVAELDGLDVARELEDNGWPEVNGYARVHAYNEGKAQVGTHVCRKPRSGPSSHTTPHPANIPHEMTAIVGRLCLCIERMADKNTEGMGILSESLAWREEVMGDALQATIQAQQDRLEAEQEAIEAYAEAQLQGEAGDDDGGALGGLLRYFMPPPPDQGGGGGGAAAAPGGDVTLDSFLATVDGNPDLFAQAIQDPRFVQRFQAAHLRNMAAKAARPHPKQKDKTEKPNG